MSEYLLSGALSHVLSAGRVIETYAGPAFDNVLLRRLLRAEYPGVWAWVRRYSLSIPYTFKVWVCRFEDLSGLEEAHSDNTTFLQEILSFAGHVYLPFLAANSAAIEAGLKWDIF